MPAGIVFQGDARELHPRPDPELAKDLAVVVVDGDDLKPFGQGHDAGVGAPERQVGVALNKLGCSLEIGGVHISRREEP